MNPHSRYLRIFGSGLLRSLVFISGALLICKSHRAANANEVSHEVHGTAEHKKADHEEADQKEEKASGEKSEIEKKSEKEGHKSATGKKEEHGHALEAAEESVLPHKSDTEEVKEMLQLLKDQVDQLPLDTLKALTDKILEKSWAGSAETIEAVKYFRKALLIGARHASELQNHSEAILDYERWKAYALQQDEFDPQMASVLIELGREYRKVGSSLTAIETFYRAMTYGRQSAADVSVLRMARWEVAETTYLMKNWERARRLYEIFLDADEQKDFLTETAYYRVGDCWRAQGDENSMILSYQQALSNNDQHPYAPEARMALLQCFLDRENLPAWTKTLNEFADSVALMQPADAIYWKRRSGELLYGLLFKKQNYDKAFQVLQALEKMDPRNEEWLQQIARWKGLVYIQKKEWDNAKSILAAKQLSRPEETTPPTSPASTESAAVPAEKKEPAQLEAKVPNTEFKDLCDWIQRSEKRKSDLGLPTQPITQ